MEKSVKLILALVALVIVIFIILAFVLQSDSNYSAEEDKISCTPEMRNIASCTAIAMPVCGYFSQDVQCIKAPCAQNYGNFCEACADLKVEFWTEGECPSS